MTTSDVGGRARRDAVVVLCRGSSRRYGSPKALARAGTDPRPLLTRVAETYAQSLAGGMSGDAWGGILVVTTADLSVACTDCLAAVPGARVVVGPHGGDTALTMAVAWAHLEHSDAACTHVWAHPVDVPGIGRRTIAQLRRVSAMSPSRAVRPTWGGRPGHPLVLPAAMLAEATPEAAGSSGPWRDLMDRAIADGRWERPLLVAVADPGVVLDHDEPDDTGRPGPGGGRSDDK